MNELKKYLQVNDITATEFARLHGFNQPTISRIINDKCRPSASIALRMSSVTGIPLDRLLSGSANDQAA